MRFASIGAADYKRNLAIWLNFILTGGGTGTAQAYPRGPGRRGQTSGDLQPRNRGLPHRI
jgi:hypothetical protein